MNGETNGGPVDASQAPELRISSGKFGKIIDAFLTKNKLKRRRRIFWDGKRPRTDLSEAEIALLINLARNPAISLDQVYAVIEILGNQWHPSAEEALVHIHLEAEDPISRWAKLQLSNYYTFSSLQHVRCMAEREVDTHYHKDVRLRRRGQELLAEIDRRLAPAELIRLELRITASETARRQFTGEVIRSSRFPQDEGLRHAFKFSEGEIVELDDFCDEWQRRTMTETDLGRPGKLLFRKLFAGKLGACLDHCYLMSRQDPKISGVVLRLHIDDPWLVALPWPSLCDDKDNRFLVRDRNVSVCIRPLGQNMQSALRPWDGSQVTRLLVILSEPDDEVSAYLARNGISLVKADTAEEQRDFEWGLRNWNRDSDKLLCLEIVPAIDDAIFKVMRNKQFDYDAVHYFGHCLHDGHQPYLVFEDLRGRRGPLRTAREFANLIGHNSALQLVTLVACQSAVQQRNVSAQPSIAAELLAEGVPSVVGMQTAIRRATGLEFARRFYHELIRSCSVTAAFHEGTRSITVRPAGERTEPEWAAPTLFIRR